MIFSSFPSLFSPKSNNFALKCIYFAKSALQICIIQIIFVTLRRKTKVLQYEPHAEGNMSRGVGGNTDILKKASKALCFGSLESRKFINYQNIAARMPIGMYLVVRVCVHTCIRRGLQCCLFGSKGNARASMSGTARLQSRFLFY